MPSSTATSRSAPSSGRRTKRLFYQRAEAHRRLEPYASRQIRVVVRLDGRAATFIIGDEGPGFDTSRLNRPVEPGDLASIGGRGLLLIRTFMDEVAFNPTGNSITMIKRLQAAADPEQGAAARTIP